MSTSFAPVLQKERIHILDSLRGIAVFGILLLNIPSMSYSVPSRDPFILNEQGTINYTIWLLNDWLIDGTQRGFFSMLFGAGIVLFMRSKSKMDSAITASDYFLRRQLWLLFFGLINIYIFLWHGDILFDYGLFGILIFVFREWGPKKLYIAAGVCLLLMLARENRDLYLNKKDIARGEAIEKMDTAVTKLSETQKEYLDEYLSFKNKTTIEGRKKRMERSRRLMTESYATNYEFRTSSYLNNIINYTYFGVWDVLLFMFIGMAFFKSGILTGNASVKTYLFLCIGGLFFGLLVSWLQLKPAIEAKYNWFELTKIKVVNYFELGRTLRTLGFFGLLMLLYKSGWFKWLFQLFRPVGQMAFTNYLAQSIIALVLFYASGFALYGKFQRYEVYLIAVAIWIVQMIWSHVWLRYFQFGPFEWIWRQLTYWKRLPLRKTS